MFFDQNTGQNPENNSFLEETFEKWPAIALAWMVWVTCLCGKRVSMGGVGDVGDLLACVAWVE